MRRSAAEALSAAVSRRLWLARLALSWERLWPALWPATGIAGLFGAVALFDVWSLAPGWLHAVALVAFGAAFALALARGLRTLHLATVADAVRRLEAASGLRHRPLAALADRPVARPGDQAAQGLWRLHLDRAARSVRRLRVGLASPGLARHDPLALRAALTLVLVVAFVAAGGDSGRRLARAFQPDFAGAAAGPAELTLWLTPPAYTGVAPLFVAAGAGAAAALQPAELVVPSATAVLARVHGGGGAPELRIDDAVVPFSTVDAANYELSATLARGRRLAVVQDGETLGSWPLTVIADQPPVIEFARAPARSQRAALRLDYLAEDDYGLAAVVATIRRRDDPAQSITLDLALPRSGARAAEETSYHDLTPHPWAGLEVTIAFTATDALGQAGTSEAIVTVLPERIFNHPVARALVEQRKALVFDPSKRTEVSNALDDISRRPQHFYEDIGVYLGLRAARWRLLYDLSDEAVAGVQDLLWDLALTIEDGPVALAERELREAQQALLDALAGDADDEEIERLIDELLAKLDEFVDALLEQALNRRDIDPGLEEQLLQSIGRDELREIIERARELARTGARDAARDLLSRLQSMLENLRAGAMFGMQQLQMGEGEAVLRGLEDLIGNQQRLLDQTFRWSQGQGELNESGGGQLGFARQEAMRRRLGDLMRRWGETGADIPRSLARAARSMRDAAGALTDRQPGQAVGPQTNAIEQMQQGARSLLDEILQGFGQGPRRPGQMGPVGNEFDPLGRGLLGRGYQDDGRTKVPDEADLQRSREVLEELHRRAGEFRRPVIERDYIRRLLRRF